MKTCEILARLSATLVLICCLAFATQSAKAQTYTKDSDITHFTSGIVSYATFSHYSSIQGCEAGSTFTPTSSELTTTGCRVFGGTLSGTGLAGSNFIEASFASPVSTIVVFPNIDHFGSSYDGYQYTIAGSNDGLTWTMLFDPTAVNGQGEPFTLGAFTGTAPTSVNNVLTPQSVGLPAGCSGTSTPCAIGYIATFSFSTAYQFYAFGTSSVASQNTDQELSGVGAAQTVTEPVSKSQPTSFDFSSGGNVLDHVVDFSNRALDYDGINPAAVQIQSTNNPVDPATWPQYVVGGPFAPSTLFPLAEDNDPSTGGKNGALFVDLCFDPTQPPGTHFGTPTDDNCPKASAGADLLAISVTASLVSKPPITPGTTTVLAHFEPNTTGQTTWSPTLGTVNPACTDTTGTSSNPAPQKCDVLDIEQSISGDQTTSSGKSRGKGTFAFAYGVPMLLSTVFVNNTQVNTPPIQPPSPSPLWFKSPLTLSFTVNPASAPPPNNNFVPAPVAGESFGILQGTNSIVPLAPIPPPTGFTTTAPVQVTFAPSSTVSLRDGKYTLEWSAVDNVGIQEQNQQLIPTPTTGTCPDGTPAAQGACYQTTLFSAPLNVDSTPPTIMPTFTPPSTGNIFAVGSAVQVSFGCADALSGIASCVGTNGLVDNGTVNTASSQVGTHTFTITATDKAGNTATQLVTYQIVGSSELLLLNLAKRTVNQGSNLTYNIAVVNFGPAVADNVVVTDTLPAGTSFVSAGYGIVSCMPGGCSDMNGPGTACSIISNTVTCNIPTVGLLFKSFTGALVKITVNVNATPGTVLKDTATVRAVNTDPFLGDNSATARTVVCSSKGSCPEHD